jgi:hypothetical protein
VVAEPRRRLTAPRHDRIARQSDRAHSRALLVPASVRARHMKSLLEAGDLLEPDLAEQIRALVPRSIVETVEGATPSAWLPLEINVELADILATALGPERSLSFFRGMVLREYQTSLFKTFITGITRAMGVSPGVFVKVVPRGWELVYQECGSFTPLDVAATQARLLFEDVPEVCVRDRRWLDAVRSTFYSAFDLANVPGSVEWDELNLKDRRAVFHFQWRSRR